MKLRYEWRILGAFFALVTIALLAVALPVRVGAQATTETVFVEVAVGGTDSVNGFARNQYGAIAPTSFMFLGRPNSWDSIRHDAADGSISARPVFPLRAGVSLTSFAVSDGHTYDDCSKPSGGSEFRCSAAQPPWVLGDTAVIRLEFSVSPAVAAEPTPVPGSESFTLPAISGPKFANYGSLLEDRGFDLSSDIGSNTRGIWSDGTTLWVYESDSNMMMAFVLADGSRDTAKDITTTEGAAGYGLWGDADADTIWLSSSGPGVGGASSTQLGAKLSAYTISTQSADTSADVNLPIALPTGGILLNARDMWSDGTSVWVMGTVRGGTQTDHRILAAYNLADGTIVAEQTIVFEAGVIGGPAVAADGEIMWVGNGGTGYPDVVVVQLEGGNIIRGGFSLQHDTSPRSFWYDSQTKTLWVLLSDPQRVVAFAADPATRPNPALALQQFPPVITDAELRPRSETADLNVSWTHNSQVVAQGEEFVAFMEYRLRSPVTGELVVPVTAFPASHVIEGLPYRGASYNILLDMRYGWHNPLGDDSITWPPYPPIPDDLWTDPESEDYQPALDNSIEVFPGETFYSAWSQPTSVFVAAPLDTVSSAVEEPVDPDRPGVVMAAADLLMVAGVAPGEVETLAVVLTTTGWLVLATVAGAALYAGTGMGTGSIYLGTFVWLLIWSGLGPFVVGIPLAQAYLPAALLLLGGGFLVLKRGRV